MLSDNMTVLNIAYKNFQTWKKGNSYFLSFFYVFWLIVL